tara:strand:- start:2562 stop:3824 length:1263 start_codon:yes stop_codon:yes gene_type:complete
MKICIIGSGGREHAICNTLSKSKNISELFCCPGNAGTKNLANNFNLNLENFEEIKNFIIENKIDLVVVGPEKPLVDGLVDYLERFKIKVFGPNKTASQLEGSKIFTKEICKKYHIPTSDFGVFTNKIDTLKFLENSNFPIVIKADNLASGKGVYISQNMEEAKIAVNEIFDGKFGVAKNILIEDFIQGEEMSYFIISDGKTIKNFGTAQDHKRVFEGDKGKNTGGMGAYSPSRMINKELEDKILNRIIKPTLRALEDLGTCYKGFLYAGLMIYNNDPYLIEYNVRMGDPECQTILPKLKTDLSEIFLACCEEKLHQKNLEWKDKKSLCVVLCSKGYPEYYKKDVMIEGINKIKLLDNDYIFHAGTSEKNGEVYAIGGRVLNFVSLSENFLTSKENVYRNLKKLNWTDGFYRKDIGYKVIK